MASNLDFIGNCQNGLRRGREPQILDLTSCKQYTLLSILIQLKTLSERTPGAFSTFLLSAARIGLIQVFPALSISGTKFVGKRPGKRNRIAEVNY